MAYAQTVKIKGTVTDANNQPLLGTSITFPDLNLGTVTTNTGRFSITLPHSDIYILHCSFLGYQLIRDTIHTNNRTEIVANYILTESTSELEGVVITGVQQRENTLTRINIKSIDQIPSASGSIESLLKTFSGVVTGNELSSQYSVRGGNFDENLIYVNDIEIHRPLLVQSAMQEGLSFVNPNMVSSVQFSAGGFDPEYGDKMSSVLDVKYKRPTEFEGTIIASLLGGSIHLAGTSKNKKLWINSGIRYKTTNYLLSSLDIEGEYQPRFTDYQALVGYNISKKSSITLLGNYSSNRFNLVPTDRSTDFGTIQQTLNLTVYYDGQERDRFDSYMGAVAYNYSPSNNLSLKFIGSVFDTDEEVNYTFDKAYWIYQISQSSSNSDTSINIGTGNSLDVARNRLKANIYSIGHKGIYVHNMSTWKWGLKAQYETINDRLNEWQTLDSAGMSIPYSSKEINTNYSYKAHNIINSYRYQAFIQNSTKFYTDNTELGLTTGLRFNYWDYNRELLLSPRASLTISPYWERKVDFYIATGLYQQPPFYKEIKNYEGKIFPDTKAQKSFHLVFGSDYHYMAWDRPFILTTEIYYKNYYRLIPYKVENIEVIYSPQYRARGYATGIDLRVNGEFVPGVDSWFSLSLLRTREDTYNDSYVKNDGTVEYPGYYRRPSDQTLTFSIFFQDYLPSNPNYKLHLLVNYGTGLPYSGPDPERPSETYLLSQYRRVDVGFSRVIKGKKKKKVGLHDIWLTVEILNLLDAPNMASYDWVRTVENNDGYQDNFAIPNYLTGRRFNFKISAKL